jgi:hypothetical protein
MGKLLNIISVSDLRQDAANIMKQLKKKQRAINYYPKRPGSSGDDRCRDV